MGNIENRDNWEVHWSNYSISAEENPAQDFRRKQIFRILQTENNSDLTIIDFGSGQGDLIKDLSLAFPQAKLVGIELSEKGVSISREKVPQAKFIQGNLLDDFVINDFCDYADYGICCEVIEHVDDPIIFVSNLKKYLKKGAKLILTVPGGKMSAFDRHIGHRKHFSVQELQDVFFSAGYINVKVKTCGFPFFNIYKIISILRGDKLISDYKSISDNKSLSLVGKIFVIISVLLN